MHRNISRTQQCKKGLGGIKLLSLPSDLVIGDIISFVNDQLKTDEGLHKRFVFRGWLFWKDETAGGS